VESVSPDNDYDYLDREDHLVDEKLVREGGILVEPEHTRKGCDDDVVECAPDDYPEDPYSVSNRPGTADDVGYSYGVESPDAADVNFIPARSKLRAGELAPDEERELEPGTIDERDLWRHMKPLIDEDVDDGIKLPAGMGDEDAARVLDAMGDEAAEASHESVDGVSATGQAGREKE